MNELLFQLSEGGVLSRYITVESIDTHVHPVVFENITRDQVECRLLFSKRSDQKFVSDIIIFSNLILRHSMLTYHLAYVRHASFDCKRSIIN